jgi:hypothetical protein
LKKVSEDKIDVQFFIVKRKVHNNPDYPAKRVQEFKPTHGALKVKKAFNDVQDFVKNVFTPEGEYQDKVYPKNIDGCRFCPYLDKPDLCNRNIP